MGQRQLEQDLDELQGDNGGCRAGLRTTEFPAARAGATLCITSSSGKLYGVMATTTPQGCLIVKPRRDLPAPGWASSGNESP